MSLIIQSRAEFEKMIIERLDESMILLANGKWSGAYYLAGYAVELALKSCIIKRLMSSDAFPERKFSENSYTHDFEKLAVSAKIKDRLDNHKKVDKVFEANWDVVRLWSEEKRYHEISRVEAEEIFVAITDTSHGVLPWIKTLW